MLTYLQSIIMSMFPCFKLADFLPERDLKGIIIDASTYSNIQQSPKAGSPFTTQS